MKNHLNTEDQRQTPVSEVDWDCVAASQTPRASAQVKDLSFEDPKSMALRANQRSAVGRGPTQLQHLWLCVKSNMILKMSSGSSDWPLI